MSADDQQFLDLLSSIPNHIRRYSDDVAGYVDKYVDKAADELRDTLATAPWVPDYIRPKLPERPPPVQIVPLSTYEKLQGWISRHKFLTGIVIVGLGYATYRTVRAGKLLRKTRRAKRARNGGRLEVVVVAGSPMLPVTKSLSLDMERRGFIVFIVCNTIEDELAVQSLSRPDIKPLSIDITDPPNAGQSIEKLAAYLQAPHAAVPGAKAHYLALKAIILIPSLNYQTSPIATIPPSSFADLFNTHLLHPILTIQSFLPLLTSRITPHGEKATPKVLVFTPSIISSINPPFHAPEATVCSALSAFTEVLTAELRPLAIPVTSIQLGTFDFSGFTPVRLGPGNGPPPPADTAQWPESARLAYARNYVSQAGSAISAGRIRGLRGSSLRDLHNAVFDVVDGTEQGAVVRVGLGAGLYGFVGRFAPRGLVAWMMGIRKVDELSAWEGSHHDSTSEKSESGEGEGEGEDGDGEGDVGEGSEYIPVTRDVDGHNVWK